MIDCCETFDSICHLAISTLLEAHGLAPKIFNPFSDIKKVYRNIKAKVKSPNRDNTDYFDMKFWQEYSKVAH